jgi:hypothetical protein
VSEGYGLQLGQAAKQVCIASHGPEAHLLMQSEMDPALLQLSLLAAQPPLQLSASVSLAWLHWAQVAQ